MKLIKLSTDHYIVVDDSEIKDVRPYIDMYHLEEGTTINKFPTYLTDLSSCKLITHSTKPIERWIEEGKLIGYKSDKIRPLTLSEVKELTGEVDVEKKAYRFRRDYQDSFKWMNECLMNDAIHRQEGYKAGYNQALEDNKDRKYTEEDLRKAIEMAREEHDYADNLSGYYWSKEEIIQSIQPKTEWEVEYDEKGKLKLKQ